MWEFHDFSITQNLREINFWDFRSTKSAILTHFQAKNYDFLHILYFLKAEFDQKIKIRVPENTIITFLELLDPPKLILRKS